MNEPVTSADFKRVIRAPRWDHHLEWFDLYPLATRVLGKPWRGDPYGQNTYATYVVSDDPGGPEDFWDEDGCDPSRVIADWASQVPPNDMGGYVSMPELWWERESNPPSTDLVLWHLCVRGLIPAGRYIVTMWW